MFTFALLFIKLLLDTLFILVLSEKCLDNKNFNLYNQEFNQFIQAYKLAKDNFENCNEKPCQCYSPIISEQLKIFKNGITKSMINKVKSKGTIYQIFDNHLYREKNCLFPSRCAGIEHFLLKLLPKLPNMDLIINTRDWPQIHKNYGTFGPVFSFSKTVHYYDIMYPAWAFWEGGPAISLYPRGIGRWDTHRKLLFNKSNETNWEQKIPKAFFRGSRTSSERDSLVLLSREQPNLVDAQFTKNQAWKSEADTLHRPPASEVSFQDHCNYKYLFNFRGVAASFRFKHLLLCKSVVVHVGDEFQEFFYTLLKPWIHYIPVNANATQKNLAVILEFLKSHDDIAKEIAENGFNLIWEKLTMGIVKCYWRRLLQKYAALLNYDITRNYDLIEISN